MNFFEHQDVARRKTGRLVLLFALAVGAVIVLTYLLAILLVGGARSEMASKTGQVAQGAWDLWQPDVFIAASLATIVIVSMGTLYKMVQLSGGGRVIAEQLGGKLLHRDAVDTPDERKLLNVVEEMAIASGIPTPPVYLMERETGINAFAAGYAPGSAVIGITKGAIERLNRDQLQGVIAHEFSHILNGDMRLNIRLMGVVHGILVIALIGNMIFRAAMYAPRGRSSRDSNLLPLVAIGLGLMIVGGIGAFFGSLIKASVSRQREFLADASAVQFTRNPGGIAGALKTIGGSQYRSLLKSPNAAEAAHMYFAQGVSISLAQLFATHPALPERIKRIEPDWDGKFLTPAPATEFAARAAWEAEKAKDARLPDFRKIMLPGVLGIADAGEAMEAEVARAAVAMPAIDLIGAPTEAHRQYAQALRAAIPASLSEPAHEAYGARAVVYALLVSRVPALREEQLANLEQSADPDVFKLTGTLLGQVDELDQRCRLPLIDIAIGTLTNLSPTQFKMFIENVTALMKADDRIDLFEWCMWRILRRHLREHFGKAKPRIVQYYSLARLGDECSTLLAAVALAGNEDRDAAQRAFVLGASVLPKVEVSWPAQKLSLDALGKALDKLVEVNHKLKRDILRACGMTVAADREVTIAEAEIMRAVADTLECPMPPVLPGQPLVGA